MFVHQNPDDAKDSEHIVYLGERFVSLAAAMAATSYDGSRHMLTRSAWDITSRIDKAAGLLNAVVHRREAPLVVLELKAKGAA